MRDRVFRVLALMVGAFFVFAGLLMLYTSFCGLSALEFINVGVGFFVGAKLFAYGLRPRSEAGEPEKDVEQQ